MNTFPPERLLELLKKHSFAKGATLAFDCYPADFQNCVDELRNDILKELPWRELSMEKFCVALQRSGVTIAFQSDRTALRNEINTILSTPRDGQKSDDVEWEEFEKETTTFQADDRYWEWELKLWTGRIPTEKIGLKNTCKIRRKRQPAQGVCNPSQDAITVLQSGNISQPAQGGEDDFCGPDPRTVAANYPQPSTGETGTPGCDVAEVASKICNGLPYSFTTGDHALIGLEISMYVRTLERRLNEALERVKELKHRLEGVHGTPEPREGIEDSSKRDEKDPFIQAIEQRDEALERVMALELSNKAYQTSAKIALAEKEQAEKKIQLLKDRATNAEVPENCPFCALIGSTGHSQESPMCNLCQLESERENLTTKLKAAEEARDKNKKAVDMYCDLRAEEGREMASLQSQLKATQMERDAALADAKSWSDQADMHATTAAGLVKELEFLRQRGGRLTVEMMEASRPVGTTVGADGYWKQWVDSLNSRLLLNWTPISMPPTETDADRNGNVAYTTPDGNIFAGKWNNQYIAQIPTHWCPSNLPPIEPKVDHTHEEIADILGGAEWSCPNDAQWNNLKKVLPEIKAALAKRGEGES